ncbi:MAG: hypothetical protein JXR53_09800, partial [Bacteroidales bacterium]|nr:hypothetical protein [Bacteroidales bacterium]
NKIIRLRARIIKNILAMISITVMFSACGGSGSDNENLVNEDSLKQVREQERLDSMARVDSIAKADSIAIEDSLKNAQNNIQIQPVVEPPNYAQPEYGVVYPYDEPDYPIDKYGVPVPEDIM